jgi:hypothetical protein
MINEKHWSEQDRQAIKDAENTLTAEELSKKIGKTKYAVSTMANILGITLVKKTRTSGGDIYYNGSPCLMFMNLDQICRNDKVKFRQVK